MLPYYKNILLVSGNGRNVGKTTFTCKLIEQFSHLGIIAVKVSPHWYTFDSKDKILHLEDKLLVMEETNTERNKDSARMLRVGAGKVYYIQSPYDKSLEKAFRLIIDTEGHKQPMVFESAALGKFMKPAFHFHINRQLKKGDKVQQTHSPVDFRLDFDGFEFSFNTGLIHWQKGSWHVSAP